MYPGFDSIIVLGSLALFVGFSINSSALLLNQSLMPMPSKVSVDADKLVFAVDFAEVDVVFDAITVDPNGSVVITDFARVGVFPDEFSVDTSGFAIAVTFVEVDINSGAVLEIAAVTCLDVSLISSLLLH